MCLEENLNLNENFLNLTFLKNFERAEITSIIMHENSPKRKVNIFSVVELCPVEQVKSPIFEVIDHKDQIKHNCLRKQISKDRTLFAVRWIDLSPEEGKNFYFGNNNVRFIPEKDSSLITIGSLIDEPPNNSPVVLNETYGGGSPLLKITPRRRCPKIAFTKLNIGLEKYDLFNETELGKLGDFTMEALGFNLRKYSEYIGSYLFVIPNPDIRQIKARLGKNKDIIQFEMLERIGRSSMNYRVELSENRAIGKGFLIRHIVTEPKFEVSIPYPPKMLNLRLFDSDGKFWHESQFGFLEQLIISSEIVGLTRELIISNENGEVVESHSIPIYSPGHEVKSGTIFETADSNIRKGEYERALETIENERKFLYFDGKDDSKAKAEGVIREILQNAKRKCLICDPYFSSKEIINYVLFVSKSRLEIKLLTSAYFLNRKLATPENPDVTEGELLQKEINKVMKKDSTIVISCRVIKGRNKCPIHDRFIVIDDNVYLLGSSLNEFGTRATTIFRIPDPRVLTRQADNWWVNQNITMSLDDWLTSRKNKEWKDDKSSK